MSEHVNELQQLLQQRRATQARTAPADGSVSAHPPRSERRFAPEVLSAAERALRDPQRLDPRWRDPLSPVGPRRAAVVAALTDTILAAKRGTVPAAVQALAQVPHTDEATLLALYNQTLGWGDVQLYFDQPETTEIKFVGGRVQLAQAGAPPVVIPTTLTAREIETRARMLAEDAGDPLNNQQPSKSFALGSGTRCTVTVPPRSTEPLVIFRRGRTHAWTLTDLVTRQSMSRAVQSLLETLLQTFRMSGLVVGSTGSGKTAFLEALMHTVPGHLITIEDGAQELRLATERLWTAQTVDVATDPRAFQHALTTVLRQTPDVVAVGECRDREAGEILSLAMTDHQIWGTIHADSPEAALRRFATLASKDGAVYAGRFDDALLDAVTSIPVLVTMQYWGQLGRRLVTSVALAVGVERDRLGTLQPMCVPLAEITSDGSTERLTWTVHATLAADGMSLQLPTTTLPAALTTRLRQNAMRTWSGGESTQAPMLRMLQMLERGHTAIQDGHPGRALAELRSAWAVRRDPRILPVVEHALQLLPDTAREMQAHARAIQQALAAGKADRQWQQLPHYLAQAEADPAVLVQIPVAEREAALQTITAGLDAWQTFDTLARHAEERITRGHGRDVLDALDALPVPLLDAARQRRRFALRTVALRDLVARGLADQTALDAALALSTEEVSL